MVLRKMIVNSTGPGPDLLTKGFGACGAKLLALAGGNSERAASKNRHRIRNIRPILVGSGGRLVSREWVALGTG